MMTGSDQVYNAWKHVSVFSNCGLYLYNGPKSDWS